MAKLEIKSVKQKNSKYVLVVRLNNTKEELDRLAKKNGSNISDFIRSIISAKFNEINGSVSFDSKEDQSEKTNHIIHLRLTNSEKMALTKIAKQYGIGTVNKMILSIVRNHILDKPIFTQDELLELKQANLLMKSIVKNITTDEANDIQMNINTSISSINKLITIASKRNDIEINQA